MPEMLSPVPTLVDALCAIGYQSTDNRSFTNNLSVYSRFDYSELRY